jgi:ABC-2 type transport system ATP-binding protein
MTAIKTEGLSKYYRDVKALDNLTMEVPKHIVFGFLGPNGAGKTTAVKLLTGFAHPTSGEAWVAGEKVGEGNLNLSRKIGLMPDVPAYYDWMSGREFLQFVGSLHHLSARELNSRTDELLALVNLEKAGKRRIGGYSRGMRQRLGIAQSLINRPEVLFLDEPTSALDPVGKREILELIKQLKTTSTIFMSTHNLWEVERVCDVVGIVNHGRLVAFSGVDALQKKYARSQFEMEFAEDPAGFIELLGQKSWLADPEAVVENGVPLVRVKAVDVDFARKELPGLIGASGLTLLRYELVLPSLEDIFVEILGKEAAV